jgi:hypothetical protein
VLLKRLIGADILMGGFQTPFLTGYALGIHALDFDVSFFKINFLTFGSVPFGVKIVIFFKYVIFLKNSTILTVQPFQLVF